MNAPSVAHERRPRTARKGRRTSQLPLPFKVFIAYADIPAARRSMKEIRDVLAAAGNRHVLEPMLWRFDQLHRPNWREVALRDASEAAVVVLASSEPGSLPAALERWISSFVRRRHSTPSTIVAVLGAADAWTISIAKTRDQARPAAAQHAAAAHPPASTPEIRSVPVRAPAFAA